MEFFTGERFASRVRHLLNKHHVPGLAAAIVQGDRIETAAYGKACINPPRDCTPETLFDAASTSKSMTAASVSLLVEECDKYRGIQWDTPVSILLPDDFVLASQAETASVTVEDILGHRSGMAPHDFSYMSPRAARPDDAKSVTRNLRNLDTAAPVRSKYMYCNMMYTAATHLVEELSGTRFADFLEDRFFQPLGMTLTNLQPSRARQKGLNDLISTGYTWDEMLSAYTEIQCMECPEAQGAGSIITCAKDYIKWIKALMNQEKPINKAVYRGLLRQRTLKNPDANNLSPRTSPDIYAAGLNTYYYRGFFVACHSGGVPGFGSHIFFLPEFKFGGVIFTNSLDGQQVAITLASELIDELLNVPTVERFDWDKAGSPAQQGTGEVEEPPAQCQSQPVVTERQRQVFPLTAYLGTFTNAGYHTLEVVVRHNKLYIDASDRSLGFTLEFEHVSEQRKYMARMKLCDELGGIKGGLISAEFRLEKERFMMGLDLEPNLGRLIWFQRITGGLPVDELREIWQNQHLV